jgi:hypothetical protein
MAITSGKNMRFLVASEPIGYAQSSTFDAEWSTISVTHKDTSNNSAEVELDQKTHSFSVEALYSEDTTINSNNRYTAVEVYDVFAAGTLVTVNFQDSSDSGSTKYTCSAYCTNISINATDSEKASYSATFTVSGAISAGS